MMNTHFNYCLMYSLLQRAFRKSKKGRKEGRKEGFLFFLHFLTYLISKFPLILFCKLRLKTCGEYLLVNSINLVNLHNSFLFFVLEKLNKKIYLGLKCKASFNLKLTNIIRWELIMLIS